jgi:muramidase (phage lysozyme)
MSPNLKAFLSTIAYSEGTDNGIQKTNDRGYDVLVGGGLFNSYADHPRKLIVLRQGLSSTAAGRYQLLARYFDAYKKQLNLKDFSPASRDAIAIQQIKECKALSDVEAGYIGVALDKCRHIWASLPGAGYGQHENNLQALLSKYTQFGGKTA